MTCDNCKKKAKHGLYRVKVGGVWVYLCAKCRDEVEKPPHALDTWR